MTPAARMLRGSFARRIPLLPRAALRSGQAFSINVADEPVAVNRQPFPKAGQTFDEPDKISAVSAAGWLSGPQLSRGR